MELKWEYLFDNIGTTKEVAVLKADDGSIVLKVFEGVYYHLSEPNYQKFCQIEPKTVLFGKEISLVKKQCRKEFSSLSSEKLAQKKLLYACNIIEKDFLNQLSSKPIIRS